MTWSKWGVSFFFIEVTHFIFSIFVKLLLISCCPNTTPRKWCHKLSSNAVDRHKLKVSLWINGFRMACCMFHSNNCGMTNLFSLVMLVTLQRTISAFWHVWMWKAMVEGKHSDMTRRPAQPCAPVSAWDRPRAVIPGGCGGGPNCPLMPSSVTHLSLSFIRTGKQFVRWVCADETSYQPLQQHFSDNISVLFAFQQHTIHAWGQSKATLQH